MALHTCDFREIPQLPGQPPHPLPATRTALARLAAAVLLGMLPAAVSYGPARAGAVVSGVVSGVWSPSGSPYWVEGDLLVNTGSTLVIQPGVQVRFRGPYRLLVNGGRLQAAGTAQDSILFTWDQPQSAHEWRGLRLVGADPATTLEYCRIEHVRSATNYPDVQGGAVYCFSCAPTIRSCRMQHNISHNANSNGMGGGVACVSASPRIENCVIRMNEADSGGGIGTMEEGCSPVIRNNLIAQNVAPYAGGGIYAGVRSSPVIENNVVSGNSSSGWGGGGINLWNSYAMNHIGKTVRNNVVVGNSTTAVGGGFYIRYDLSILENNTVAGNTAAGGGGGLYILNAGQGDYPPEVRNFTIWGNTGGGPQGIYLDPTYSTAVNVSYSDVQGGWSGAGNINADPLFADGVYHLGTGSPCIDQGDAGTAYNDACVPPSLGGVRNDMGAFGGPGACGWPGDLSGAEEQGCADCPAVPENWTAAALRFRASPQPFAGSTVLRYELPAAARVRIAAYDANGALVRVLAPGRIEEPGAHVVPWDGTNDRGRRVPAGAYFTRIEAAGRVATGTVIVIN